MKFRLLLTFCLFFFILISAKAEKEDILIVDPDFKVILSLPISGRIDSITAYFEKSNMLPPQKIRILKDQLEGLESEDPFYSAKIILLLGYQYEELSQYEEAKDACLEVVSLLSEQGAIDFDEQILLGKGYEFLVSLYYKTEDWTNLENTADEAIEILNISKDSVALGNLTHLYGAAFLMQKKYEEALAQFENAKTLPFKKEDQFLDNEYSMALALIGLDRSKKAMTVFETLLSKMVEREHNKYADAILIYADLLSSLKKYKDAEKYYLEAHNIAIQNKKWNDLKLISTKIALLHEKNNKLEKALEFRKILETYADSFHMAQSASTLENTNLEFESLRTEIMLLKAKYEQMLTEADAKLAANRKFINFFLLLSILTFGFICYFMFRKVNSSVAKNEDEFKKTKEKLFDTVSHEIRDPVILSHSYIKKLKDEDLPNNIEHLVNATDKSLNGLIGHINTLLDWNRIESNSLDLALTKNSYPEILEEVFESVKTNYKDKDIIWLLDIIPQRLVCELDFENLNKVVSILLNNAASIVSSGAIISMTSRIVSDNQLRIDIKDNGSGIPDNKAADIFEWEYSEDRFSNKNSNKFEINMSLADQLAKLMNGKLNFVNNSNVGAHFSLLLPFTFVKEKQMVSQIANIVSNTRKRPTVLLKPDEDRSNILLIEDHIEFSNFVSDTLSDDYNVSIAHDPKIGLAISYKEIPDLIICDLISSDHTNLEIYNKLRYHILTDHIPMILFTTKEEDKENYLERFRPRDGFLDKPFEGQVLLSMIDTILTNRAKIDLSKIIKDLKEGKEVSKFEELLISVLEKNYHKVDFNAEQFAEQIKMTKGQMLKKMRSMYDDNASMVLTDYRLLKSKQLLEEGSYTIDQIAEKCGFRNTEYFITVFKGNFQTDPSNAIL